MIVVVVRREMEIYFLLLLGHDELSSTHGSSHEMRNRYSSDVPNTVLDTEYIGHKNLGIRI